MFPKFWRENKKTEGFTPVFAAGVFLVNHLRNLYDNLVNKTVSNDFLFL